MLTPALIIANGESCTVDLLQQVLELNPTVFVLDSAISRVSELCKKYSYKVDFLVGDFDDGIDSDQLNLRQVKVDHPNIQIIQIEDQYKTDLEKGLQLAIDNGHKKIIILWATGRRLDHTIANLINISKFHEQVDIVMIDDYTIARVLDKNFKKSYKAGEVISLIPMGKVEHMNSKGLLFELNDMTLEMGKMIGNSNSAAKDGLVEITYQEGVVFLMECMERRVVLGIFDNHKS